jgi:iron complex outermembrane receptor protein
LQLKGGITWAFRAPTVYQSFPGFAVIPTLFPAMPIPLFIPVQVFGNPHLNPETALIESAGIQWQIIDELGFTVDFWNYDYRHRIRPQSPAALYAEYTANPNNPPAGVLIDPASGKIERVQVQQINYPGDVVTNGLDLGGAITLTGATFGGDKNDWGAIQLGTMGTYTITYDYPRSEAVNIQTTTAPVMTYPPLHCGMTSCSAVGSRNTKPFAPGGLPIPRWRLNFPLTYAYDGHAASVIGHYISSVIDDNQVNPNGTLGTVGAWFSVDLQYGYTIKDWIGKELTFRVGAYNIFDKLPPAANGTLGFDPLLHDPRGRMVYAKLIAQF